MKSSILAIIPLLAGLSATQETYATLCNDDRDSTAAGTKQLSDGKTVDWKCNVGPTASPKWSLTSPDPESCWNLCDDPQYSTCTDISWSRKSDACYLFENKSETRKLRGWVWARLSDAPQPTDCSMELGWFKDAQADYSKCDVDLKTALSNLKTCKKNADSLDGGSNNLNNLLTKCTDDKDKCEKDLALAGKCPDSGMDQLVDDLQLCPSMDNKIQTVDKIDYTIHCNQGVKTGVNVYREEDLFFTDCIAECSKDYKCQGINYWFKNDERCIMYDQYTTALSDKSNGEQFISAIPTKKR